MTDPNAQLIIETDAQNLSIVANMIDLTTETICKIGDEYVNVGNDYQAKRDISESVGANILTAILKEAGV